MQISLVATGLRGGFGGREKGYSIPFLEGEVRENSVITAN